MSGFSDKKRTYIRNELLDTGRELFARYGLKKTTISDLTEPVGIANGTFYQFFDSKEALYLELLEEEGEELAEQFIAESFEQYEEPKAAIEAFILAVMDEIETNPLIHQIVIEDELGRLRDDFSEKELQDEQERDIAYFLPYVEAWYEQGEIEGPSPEIIAHAIRSVTFLTLHKEDIPMYESVKETTSSALARGLTNTST
jgi:AcrR family transcriptional regulator